jgi:phenylpropionate dioxygenase-like ring-hydroxylating dioxygenase large terminal subunit
MFINFWYPVVLSRELAEAPRRVRILAQDLVAFRDGGGAARVLSNTCTHRGGSLAGGKVRGDHIQCPYHGWQFDGSGACRRIPSLGAHAKIPARARVDAYPVAEKYGIVFAFLGDLPEAERPPMLEVPEFDDPAWRATWINYQVDCNYERSIENGLDAAHNEFVHPTHGFSGRNEDYKVRDLRWVGDGRWGPGFFHRFRSPASTDPTFAAMKKADDNREAGSGTIGPNHMWTYIRFGEGREMRQYMWEAPIDERRTNIFFVNMRNTFIEPEMDQRVGERNWMIAEQDIVVLRDLEPRETPPTNTKEFMVPADEPILRYRAKLAEFEDRGWRIDTDAVNRNRLKAACAIPGPERRTTRGWVLDPVPLLRSGAAAQVAARHESAG